MALKVALDVRPEYLDAAMQTLDADYGGLENYLETAGNLKAADRERLQQLLLC